MTTPNDRQRELLKAIVVLNQTKGFPGTYRELGEQLGLGPSRICQLVDQLERRRLVRRISRAGRTLTVTAAGLKEIRA